jgi:hypothetical protein
MQPRGSFAWIVLALAGIVLVAAVSLGASSLSGQKIGLASEPPSAGQALAPTTAATSAADARAARRQEARRRKARERRRARARARREHAAASPAPAPAQVAPQPRVTPVRPAAPAAATPAPSREMEHRGSGDRSGSDDHGGSSGSDD